MTSTVSSYVIKNAHYRWVELADSSSSRLGIVLGHLGWVPARPTTRRHERQIRGLPRDSVMGVALGTVAFGLATPLEAE